MSSVDEQAVLRKLQRIIETQDVLRDYVSNLKERMSAIEGMLGTQMMQIGRMQLRIDRLEEISRQNEPREPRPDPLPEIH